MELFNYLSEEEKHQMEDLMQKAVERRGRDNGKEDETVSCTFYHLQYDNRKRTDDEAAGRRTCYETDLRCLVDQVCGFFQRHGYCNMCRKKAEEAMDEELPFD
ncbi:hypothetical protein [Bacteroides acidifaciens]|jgi:hypothetical protein|uniref:hypothetical protein n=1 Tax=Bacteroides acidifaciens TaxID=85831 RepID=UPI0030148E5B